MDKATLRTELAGQGPPAPDTVDLIAGAMFDFLSPRLPGTVCGYLAMADEIDVSSLLERLPGWRWVLPRVEKDGSLTLRDGQVAREVHKWGMSQPVDSGPVIPPSQLDIVLVPGLAFDHTGSRLGRGGGYYDRLLARCRADCMKIGVIEAERVVSLVPTEKHDQPVGWLATEHGVKECAPTS